MNKGLLFTILVLLSCNSTAPLKLNGEVKTLDAVDIKSESAVLKGSISGFDFAPREVGFEWGYAPDKLSYVLQSADILDSGSGFFSEKLSGLNDSVTIYYRAYALFWKGEAAYRFGEVRSFKTLQEDDKPQPGPGTDTPTGSVTPPGWYELPSMNIGLSGSYMMNKDNTDQYYTWHMCSGGEKGPGGKTARNYTVCFSAEQHCPVWVAAPRHDMYVGNAGRTNAYRQDASIPLDIQYNATTTGGGCNKGHMLGSAERTSSTETNRDVFFYPNIAPQLSGGFNTGGGGWNTLEDWVDKQVCADTLYEVLGCYFKEFTDGYGNNVKPAKISFGGLDDAGFPTMFYYVLLRTKSGDSGKALKDCSASELKCAAFVRSHSNDLKGQKVSSKEMMSVADLEKITGVTYFPNVPNAPKSSFSASDWGL